MWMGSCQPVDSFPQAPVTVGTVLDGRADRAGDERSRDFTIFVKPNYGSTERCVDHLHHSKLNLRATEHPALTSTQEEKSHIWENSNFQATALAKNVQPVHAPRKPDRREHDERICHKKSARRDRILPQQCTKLRPSEKSRNPRSKRDQSAQTAAR